MKKIATASCVSRFNILALPLVLQLDGVNVLGVLLRR
jgi:hypothetical protein